MSKSWRDQSSLLIAYYCAPPKEARERYTQASCPLQRGIASGVARPRHDSPTVSLRAAGGEVIPSGSGRDALLPSAYHIARRRDGLTMKSDHNT